MSAPDYSPSTPCRTAYDSEIPRTARSLAKLAEGNGWTVVITYANGWWVTSKAHKPKLIDSIAVRMFRIGSPRAVAFWHDGKFHAAVTSRLDMGVLNSAAIRAVITTEVQ